MIIPGPNIAPHTTPIPETTKNGKNSLKISIASTFTSHPLEDPLKFWGETFGYETTVRFSPYDQVFQELLDPQSSLNQPDQDARVLLLRTDDWIRNLSFSGELSLHSHIVSNIHDLKSFAVTAASIVDSPLFVTIARNSRNSRIRPENQAYYEQFIKNELASYTHIHVTTTDDIDKTYGVDDYEDVQRDQLGHIPFKNEYFTSLATSVFRNLMASRQTPYKVIVLDCDNTLWGGVCGEVSPEQLDLSGPYASLHSFMLEQKASGKILCLCSKNVREDVDRVFRERTDMLIRSEDIVTSRINWEPKSRNLRELADELNLGLDSFIFIDDNPVECAEVRANCPEVFTLNLPESPEDFGRFLDHTWVFDSLTSTSEDKKRTQLYKENLQRSSLQQRSSSLKAFIDGLDLQIRITDATPEEIPRVSQLTYRTNQFNFTTIRRSEKEIRELIDKESYVCKVCRVRDRFGDYGLVGALIFRVEPDRILLDSFMLSCRVLGRGVEHRMLASIGESAHTQGLEIVDIQFAGSEKNRPARTFLKSVLRGLAATIPTTDGGYLLPSTYVNGLTYTPDESNPDGHEGPRKSESTDTGRPSAHPDRIFEHIANELHHPSKIHALVYPKEASRNGQPSTSSASDQDPVQIITGIWTNLLGRPHIGPDEHFFAVGGTSLKAVEVLSQLNERFNKNLSIVSLFEHSTIRSLADLVENKETQPAEFDWILKRSESRRNRLRRRE
ncbi:MAG: HAD-IIIC family phosphatase [Balneolaceae bacterium]